jgi:dihydroneopterin aldolase
MGLAEPLVFAVPELEYREADRAEDPLSGITVFIRDLSVQTVIGVPDDERRQPQSLLMDLDIELDANHAAQTDHLADTVDYAAVVDDIRDCLAGKNYFLLERLAEFVAARILDVFGARRVSVQVAKVGILKDVRLVGVKVTRSRAGKRRVP